MNIRKEKNEHEKRASWQKTALEYMLIFSKVIIQYD